MSNSTIFRNLAAFVAASVTTATFAISTVTPSVAAEKAGTTTVTQSVLVNAPPKVVWDAVYQERHHSPDIAYTKVLSESERHEVIEQKFTGIPILGSVVAVTKHSKEPAKRIEYSLVKSDKFKKMEGIWTFTPANNGTATEVKLTNFLDIGVPFSGGIIKSATKKNISRRLANVKKFAEREQARLAASGQTQ